MFVSARGGGLLILGGQESFTKGKYDQTPLGELSPVYIAAQTVEKLGERAKAACCGAT